VWAARYILEVILLTQFKKILLPLPLPLNIFFPYVFVSLYEQRITEIAGVVLSLDPKPIQVRILFPLFSFKFVPFNSKTLFCSIPELVFNIGSACPTRVIGMELVLTQTTGTMSHL
jgi:hypothetical protein